MVIINDLPKSKINMNRIYLILLFSLITHYCFSQEIVNDVVGMSGENISNSEILINHTSGELVSTTINNSDIILTQGFQQTSNILYLSPKVFLQGALLNSTNNLMRDDLREDNYLPPASPYNNKTVVADNLFETATDDAIVDWVNIELRNSENRIVSKKSALVQKDGGIVNANGNSNLQFTTNNKDYFVVVKHRNHLGTMTANQVSFNTNPALLDFTDGSVSTYGNNGQVLFDTDTYALWAGNANNDTRIRYQGSGNDTNYIKDKIVSHPNNTNNNNLFFYNGYDVADVNMDGRIRYQGSGNDSNIIKDIILTHPNNLSLSNLYFFIQQIPN